MSKLRLNENFVKLYGDISKDKNCTILDILQEDGSVMVDNTVNQKYMGVIELHNCINNPFYFIDKLSIKDDAGNDIKMPINIASFMSVKMLHTKKTNIIVDHQIKTHVNDFILGYALYLLLTTDKKIILNSSTAEQENTFKDKIHIMYHTMPNYLKIKTIDLDRVMSFRNIKESEVLSPENIALLIYMDSYAIAPSKIKLDTGLLTVVSNEGGDSRNIKYLFEQCHSGFGFKIIDFDVKTMGITNEELEMDIKELNNDMSEVLKKVFLMYDAMTEEEAQLLEENN